MKSKILPLLTAVMCVVSALPVAAQPPLETEYFYFDNPDGNIEAFAQYINPTMRNWAMSISSKAYTPALKSQPTGPNADLINLLFGRSARTTVFVMDTKGMTDAALTSTAQTALMLGSNYSAKILGLTGALWQAMDEMVSRQVKTHISSDFRDGMTIGQPQPVTFMGKEAVRVTSTMDMAQSPMMTVMGMPMRFTFDTYVYHDEEYDKMVAVTFNTTTMSDLASMSDGARSYTELYNSLSIMLGYGDANTGQTAMQQSYPGGDMKAYFEQHFHLKKGDDIERTCTPCETRTVGRGANMKFIVCCDTIEVDPPIFFTTTPTDTTITLPPEQPGERHHINPQPPEQPKVETTIRSGGDRDLKKRFAVIHLPSGVTHSMCEDENSYYFLEAVNPWGNSSNAVVALDKSTGAYRDVIVPQTKSPRANIHHIGSDGKSLYLASEELGILRYDGKSLASSQQLVDGHCENNGETGRIIFSPNGRYMAYAGNCCYVYDLQDGNKRVKRYLGDLFTDAVLTNAGDIYKADGWNVSLARNNGIENDDNIDSRSIGIACGGGAQCLQVLGDDVVLVGAEKTIKTASGAFDWGPVGELPSGISFEHAYLDRQGNIFGHVSGMVNDFVAIFAIGTVDDLVHARAMGTLDTETRDDSGYVEKVQSADYIYIDLAGNVWMQMADWIWVVYNENGIVGLSNLAGKNTTLKRK